KRACLRDKRSHDKTASSGQDTALFPGSDRPDIATHRTESWLDRLFEIFEMRRIRKDLPGDHEGGAGARRRVHCDMYALFRADASEDERVTALFRERAIVDAYAVAYRVDEA